MVVGFLKDSKSAIAPIVPGNIQKLKEFCEKVLIEKDIGKGAFFSDVKYSGALVKEKKAIIAQADILVKATPEFSEEEYKLVKKDGVVISQFAPFADDGIIDKLDSMGINAFSLDMIPRTSLAQSMDILSSMASIAGYQSILIALDYMPRYMPMMITAAGSIKPSKVLIIGAGVAGLQAVATARRLGAIVEVFDTRTAVKEEVESLGARFVEVEGAKDEKEAGGYAVEQTKEYKKKQAELIHEKAKSSDIVVTTAQLRGKPAPKIISKATVESMKPGSVVVDLAASTGGNCELTRDNKVVFHKGIHIIGNSNLANRMAQDASILYSNNVLNFLRHIVKEGSIDLNSDDEILSKSLINKKG